MTKQIVMIVNSVIYHNNEPYINTLYEVDRATLTHSNLCWSWGNHWLDKNHAGPENDHWRVNCFIDYPDLRFESLDSITNFDENKIYFYLIPCSSEGDAGNVKYFQFLRMDQIKKLADNNVNILFDYSMEVFEPVRCGQYLDRFHLVLYNSNSLYSGKMVVSSANKNSIHNSFVPVALPMRALIERSGFAYAPNTVDIDLNRYFDQPKNKLFLHLNMQPRMHRLYFIHRLIVSGLMQHSMTSLMGDKFNKIQFGNGRIDNRIIHDHSNLIKTKNFSISPEDLLTMYHAITVSLPTMFIENDTISNELDQNHLYNSEWAYSTCFDLIAETGSFSDGLNTPVFSEKTIKSIFYKRPFMINGDQGSLEMLSLYGFRTYNEVFDEAYDMYPNLFDRHEIIIQNIRQYADDYSKFMLLIRNSAVMEHNYHVLMDPNSLESIIVRLLNEVGITNVI